MCHRLLGKQTGLTPDAPYLDPCLPLDIKDEIRQNGQTVYLRGTGDFDLCRKILQPFMNKTNETQTSLNGVYQPPIYFQNSEFYGFSEFYYCTEDVLRMGGDYNAAKFTKAAKVNLPRNPVLLHAFERPEWTGIGHISLHSWRGSWSTGGYGLAVGNPVPLGWGDENSHRRSKESTGS